MNFHVKVVLAVAVLVAAALAMIFFLRSSDEEAIEKLLQDGAAAASRQDAEAVIALLSKSFRSKEGDYAWAVERIRGVLKQPVGQLSVSPGGITVEGDEASARVGLRASAGPREMGRTSFDFRFRRENGVWKVISAEEIR
jgi:hypothetical protein